MSDAEVCTMLQVRMMHRGETRPGAAVALRAIGACRGDGDPALQCASYTDDADGYPTIVKSKPCGLPRFLYGHLNVNVHNVDTAM
jgi:hypothetical protein